MYLEKKVRGSRTYALECNKLARYQEKKMVILSLGRGQYDVWSYSYAKPGSKFEALGQVLEEKIYFAGSY